MVKINIIFFIFLIFVSGCRLEKEAVKITLENFAKCVVNEDLELLTKIVAQDSDMVNIDEKGNIIVGWYNFEKIMKSQFSNFSETNIKVDRLSVKLSNDVQSAWATERWNLKTKVNEKDVHMPLTWTFLLENRENNWVIVHFHKSIVRQSLP